MSSSFVLPPDYWKSISITKSDIDYLTSYLFESERPMSEEEMVSLLVHKRFQDERETAIKKQQADSKVYLPKEYYQAGDRLAFPALGWKKGVVSSVRPGLNPEAGEFEVVAVTFEDGETGEFAAGLTNHKLNRLPETPEVDDANLTQVLTLYGAELRQVLAFALQKDGTLVRVAGRWFPRALLTDINVGHLNVVEAVLEEAGGGPLPASALLRHLGLAEKVSPVLEFSLNYALQQDGRFDEVGPAGEVLWCLLRSEPEDVREIPAHLRYAPIEYEQEVLTDEMRALEASLDDELSELPPPRSLPAEVTLALTYPHWRAGTLPISERMRALFPTAYESPRVRFNLIDGESGEEIPAWVVRHHAYVAGLGGLYPKYGLMPGSLLTVQRVGKSDRVVVRPHLRRPVRDWVRTVLVGRDGGIVFANLKQNITADYDERMVVYVPDVEGVDLASTQLLKAHWPFEKLVAKIMRELSKLNVQGHVHVQELYSAFNIIRRCPPGPLLAALADSQKYVHVGDLHFRLIASSEDME